MLISVVLPAPLGPSRPKNSPGSTSRLDAVERPHAAETARDVDDFTGGGHACREDIARAIAAGDSFGRRRLMT